MEFLVRVLCTEFYIAHSTKPTQVKDSPDTIGEKSGQARGGRRYYKLGSSQALFAEHVGFVLSISPTLPQNSLPLCPAFSAGVSSVSIMDPFIVKPHTLQSSYTFFTL